MHSIQGKSVTFGAKAKKAMYLPIAIGVVLLLLFGGFATPSLGHASAGGSAASNPISVAEGYIVEEVVDYLDLINPTGLAVDMWGYVLIADPGKVNAPGANQEPRDAALYKIARWGQVTYGPVVASGIEADIFGVGWCSNLSNLAPNPANDLVCLVSHAITGPDSIRWYQYLLLPATGTDVWWAIRKSSGFFTPCDLAFSPDQDWLYVGGVGTTSAVGPGPIKIAIGANGLPTGEEVPLEPAWPPGLMTPYVAVNGSGDLFVSMVPADGTSWSIRVYPKGTGPGINCTDGVAIVTFSKPVGGMAFDCWGGLYVFDGGAGEIRRYNVTLGAGTCTLSSPWTLACEIPIPITGANVPDRDAFAGDLVFDFFSGSFYLCTVGNYFTRATSETAPVVFPKDGAVYRISRWGLLESFEDLLESQKELKGSYEELIKRHWDSLPRKEQIKLLESFEDLLKSNEDLLISFGVDKIARYSTNDPHGAPPKLLFSFESLLGMQAKLLKSFEDLLMKLRPRPTYLVVSFEDLLKSQEGLLRLFERLLKDRVSVGKHPCQVHPDVMARLLESFEDLIKRQEELLKSFGGFVVIPEPGALQPEPWGWGEVHEVAAISQSAEPASVIVGEIVTLAVAVENRGNVTESFDVAVYYDDAEIGTQPVTDLPPGGNQTLTLLWDTDGVPPGIYDIRAKADSADIITEVDEDNNWCTATALVTIGETLVGELRYIDTLLDELIATVRASGSEASVKATLVSLLATAKGYKEMGLAYIEAGQNHQAKTMLSASLNQMRSFISWVEALQGMNLISAADADNFIDRAQEIISRLQTVIDRL